MARFDFEAGFARLDAAMTGGGAPEVPIIAQMHEFAMKASGVPGHVFYSDARAFVEGICTAARDYGFDTPSFIWDGRESDAQALPTPPKRRPSCRRARRLPPRRVRSCHRKKSVSTTSISR